MAAKHSSTFRGAERAQEVPVVEGEAVGHEYADGWEEIEEGGMVTMRLYRRKGPKDDPENEVFLDVHMPAWLYNARLAAGGQSCIRNCDRRLAGMRAD